MLPVLHLRNSNSKHTALLLFVKFVKFRCPGESRFAPPRDARPRTATKLRKQFDKSTTVQHIPTRLPISRAPPITVTPSPSNHLTRLHNCNVRLRIVAASKSSTCSADRRECVETEDGITDTEGEGYTGG